MSWALQCQAAGCYTWRQEIDRAERCNGPTGESHDHTTTTGATRAVGRGNGLILGPHVRPASTTGGQNGAAGGVDP